MAFDVGLVVTFSLCVWVVIDLLAAGGARDRRLPFVALASTSGIWVLGELIGRRATTPEEFLLARRTLHFGVGLLPVAWLVTAATAARAPWLHRAPWLVLVPLGSAALVYSFLYWDTGGYFITGSFQAPEYGPVFWYSAGVGWALILVGTGYFLAAASRLDRARPLRIVAVALGSTMPLLGNVLYIFGLVGELDPTPLLIGAGGVVLRFAVIDTGLSAMLRRASDGVFERLKTGVLLADLEGRVVDANPMARSLTDHAEPNGAPLDDLVARALEKPDRAIDVERMDLRRPLGDLGQAVLLTDRTEAVKLENRLREAQRRESLELMATGVAHDFSNALMVIRGCAERARDRLEGDHAAIPSLEQLVDATRAAGRLVEQLLAYAGQQGGAARLLDLKSELEGLRGLAKAAAGQRARIEFELADDLPPVEANPVEVQQLLVNLVSNAGQAIEERGTIRVRASAERLSSADLDSARPGHHACPGDYVVIEVADDGRGMDAPTLDRIFDPFFTTREEGHGLGLAVLLGIVHACGGALQVASTPGVGTIFRIHLPAASARATPEAPEPMPRLAVLVVDDDPDIRALIAHMLEKLGCLPVSAASAREAETLLRRRRARLDVALVDLELPDRSGGELCRDLRGLQPQLGIVVISGHPPEEVRKRLAGDRVEAILKKPFEPEALSRALRAAVPGRARQPASDGPRAGD